MINFYDTSALLEIKDNKYEEPFVISSVTLDELNDIKDNKNKTPEVRAQARRVINWLNENEDKYSVILYKPSMLTLNKYDLEVTNDIKILVSALSTLDKNVKSTFWCNDGGFRRIAKEFDFFSEIKPYKAPKKDDYKGYVELVLDDDQLNTLYSDRTVNSLNLLTNEYAIIKTADGIITDRICWDGKRYRNISYSSFESQWFGEVKPMVGDVYQQLASDALLHSQVTMLAGKSGTGKSQLAISYIMSQIESGRRKKVIIFANPVAAKNAAKLGWLPGDKFSKLIDTSIGGILSSKLGGQDEVERLVNIKKIDLIPFSDLRGYDTNGMNAIVYIPEAENLDSELMKLAMTRLGEDCQMIIDGDYKQQTDLDIYEQDNGMRKVIDVYKGDESFAMVDLQIVHRSHVAELAQRL